MSIFKIILVSTLGLSSLGFSQTCPLVAVPDQFSIEEKIISFNAGLDIKDANRNSIGKVGRRFLTFSRQFYFRDAKKNLVANGRARIFSWGHHVDITDCNGDRIGSIREQIFPTAITGGIYSVYTFTDAKNKVTAVSQKVELLATKFDIFTAEAPQKQIATVTRSLFGKIFKDRWTVQVFDSQAVDKRFLVMLAVFKTSRDNDQARDDRRNVDEESSEDDVAP